MVLMQGFGGWKTQRVHGYLVIHIKTSKVLETLLASKEIKISLAVQASNEIS